MSVTRVGATKQYSDNWENIFGGNGRSATKKQAAAPVSKSAKQKSAKKKAAGKAAKKSARRA
jgi:hypothetical protein